MFSYSKETVTERRSTENKNEATARGMEKKEKEKNYINEKRGDL